VEIKCTHNTIKMAHKYDQEHSKEEVKLPEQFKCHEPLFSDEEANAFPPVRGEGDHKIELLETAPRSFNCKVYSMSRGEQEMEDKFIDENLAKGYIVPSNSPYGFSMFIVPKKDSKEKQYIIDYRPLNAITRKDVTPLPNLGQCIKDLQGMEIFSKFNICWGYNNIRICEGDEWKEAFKIRRGLFEPRVMFFGMSNLPASFQRFVNTQIMEEFCQKFREKGRRCLKNYMDNFGLGTSLKDIDIHIEMIHFLFVKVQDLDGVMCTSCYWVSSACTTKWSFQRTLVNEVLTDGLRQDKGGQVESPSNARDDSEIEGREKHTKGMELQDIWIENQVKLKA